MLHLDGSSGQDNILASEENVGPRRLVLFSNELDLCDESLLVLADLDRLVIRIKNLLIVS